MIVRQIRVGPMANFVYLLVDETSREAIAVDSGWETGPIAKALTETGGKLRFAVATHGHFDHTSTLRELADATGASVVAHSNSSIECDVSVRDGGELKVGKEKLMVIHTPGHTEDSICLYGDRRVFTGDTLFVGSIGRFEKSSSDEMYRSLHQRILSLPESTEFYPGHDYGEVPFRRLGEERRTNPFLMTRDFRSFASLFG